MAINFLPVLLIAGAAAVVVSASVKKKSKSKPRVIDMGLYSYSSDCKRLWIGDVDVTTPAALQLNAEQNEAMGKFVAGPLESAITAAVADRSGDSSWGERPFWITELGLGVIAKLVPQCKFVEGRPTGKAALALLPLAFGRIGLHMNELGLSSKEFLAAAAEETALMAKAAAKKGGTIDLVKTIREAREGQS